MHAATGAATAQDEGAGRWAILLAGISGDPELQQDFLEQLRQLRDLLEGPMGFPKDRVYVLFDDPARDPERIRLKSTRENLEKACREIAARARRDDLVFVFLAGHGSYDGKTYKLNLVGPDPTAEDLAATLYSIPAQRFIVVNTTTGSGASVAALSARGKLVVAATRSGQERNRTHMGRFFIEALLENRGDQDKNGRVSMLEAFQYANQKVEELYSREGNLRTEHAVLDDDGDGEAHIAPGPENGDGFLARTSYLDAGSALLTKGMSPQERELAKQAEDLERQIEALRYLKADMPEAEYEKKLEALLLKLAEIHAKLRRK